MKSEIKFLSGGAEGIEVLILSKEGVWANPNVPVDETAKYVLNALDVYIKNMVEDAVRAEREACAKVCDEVGMLGRDGLGKFWADKCIAAIRARGELDRG